MIASHEKLPLRDSIKRLAIATARKIDTYGMPIISGAAITSASIAAAYTNKAPQSANTNPDLWQVTMYGVALMGLAMTYIFIPKIATDGLFSKIFVNKILAECDESLKARRRGNDENAAFDKILGLRIKKATASAIALIMVGAIAGTGLGKVGTQDYVKQQKEKGPYFMNPVPNLAKMFHPAP